MGEVKWLPNSDRVRCSWTVSRLRLLCVRIQSLVELSLPTFLSSCTGVLPLVSTILNNTVDKLALSSRKEGEYKSRKRDTKKFQTIQGNNIGGMKLSSKQKLLNSPLMALEISPEWKRFKTKNSMHDYMLSHRIILACLWMTDVFK